jgi:hypothetical protein
VVNGDTLAGMSPISIAILDPAPGSANREPGAFVSASALRYQRVKENPT